MRGFLLGRDLDLWELVYQRLNFNNTMLLGNQSLVNQLPQEAAISIKKTLQRNPNRPMIFAMQR